MNSSLFIRLIGIVLLVTSLSKRDAESSNAVSLVFKKQEGEIIGEYKLIQHLDVLGVQRQYSHDYYLNKIYKLAPPLYSPPTLTTKDNSEKTQITVVDDVYLDETSKNIRNGSFYLNMNIFNGGHGEIWRANRISKDGLLDRNISYVLKRMHIKGKPQILRCALREIYYGEMFRGYPRIARYVTYFTTEEDYWLVFKDEGVSLQQLLYVMTYHDSIALLEPSIFWRKLRTTDAGVDGLRSILHQLISGVQDLHKRNTLHRDIKPSNILINTEDNPTLLVADFSSAVSVGGHTNNDQQDLYGERGPSVDEESPLYMPPEVLFSDGATAFDEAFPESYDSWSVGVVFLEMLLGTANVFSVDQRTSALIAHRLRKSEANMIRQAELLAALADYCIYDPQKLQSAASESGTTVVRDSGGGSVTAAVTALLHPVTTTSRCGLEELAHAIQRRDPLGSGYHDQWGLDLLSRLLTWNSTSRLSMEESLAHAFFVGPYQSDIDGSQHALLRLRQEHDLALVREGYELEEETGGSSVNTVAVDASLTQSVLQLLDISAPDSAANYAFFNETWHYEGAEGLVTDADLLKEHRTSNSATADIIAIPMDPIDVLDFYCPVCGRVFHGDWQSCNTHVHHRRHGDRCQYHASAALPLCLSEHSLLPLDSQSGWCDLKGRRRHIEDNHAVVFAEAYKFWAVLDGHFGSHAAKFTSVHLHRSFEKLLRNATSSYSPAQLSAMWTTTTASAHSFPANNSFIDSLVPLAQSEQLVRNFSSDGTATSDVSVTAAMCALRDAFVRTHHKFLESSSAGERSGTTATAAVLFENHLLVGHVGDSRAVLCCDQSGLAVQLTNDHTPYVQAEADRVRQSGGWVEHYGVLRVNGQLAVTRSIGDRGLRDVLSEVPDILVLRLQPNVVDTTRSSNGSDNGGPAASRPCVLYARHQLGLGRGQRESTSTSASSSLMFLIVGSDGLWDVMTNQEASDLVCERLLTSISAGLGGEGTERATTTATLPPDAMHEASRMLAQEAFVRGSMDNIGVCIIGISH